MPVWRSGPPRRSAHTLAFSYSKVGAKYPKVTERRSHQGKQACDFQDPASTGSGIHTAKVPWSPAAKTKPKHKVPRVGKVSSKMGRNAFVEPTVNSSSSSHAMTSTRSKESWENIFWKIKSQVLQQGFVEDPDRGVLIAPAGPLLVKPHPTPQPQGRPDKNAFAKDPLFSTPSR